MTFNAESIQPTVSSQIDAAYNNATESARLGRNRNRVMAWTVVVALLLNAVFVTGGVLRDQQRTHTIKNLSTVVSGLTTQNKTLGDQLAARNAYSDKALMDAFALLNQLRDTVANNTSQLNANTNKILALEAYIQVLLNRKPGQSIIVRPRIVVSPPVAVPPPITLPPMTESPSPPPVRQPPPPVTTCVVPLLKLICL